jgi:hypothetical protein
MAVNVLGPVAAASAFLGIWLGHVTVRKVEYISPTIWLPTVLFASAGLGLEIASLSTSSRAVSLSLGIIGITLLWDALEMTRQQRRVRKGHAPANPSNPRHALILTEYPAATPNNLLKREPLGRRVTTEEASRLLEHQR